MIPNNAIGQVRSISMKRVFFIAALLSGICSFAASASTNLLEVVRRYADTMVERGRDTHGTQKSGLLLSALDRCTLAPLKVRPAPPGGIRRGDRPGRPWVEMNGANPMLDQNLLRVFYALSEITGDTRYARVADEELTWFFNNTMSPKTSLLPWGEHLSWDVMLDVPISGGEEMMHEYARPWALWDRCFALAPEASVKFALGVWEHQIANHKTGGFDRHAPYFEHGPVDGKDFPRHAGFYIGTWCYAWKYGTNEVFLRAIETLLARFERKRVQKDGSLAATIGPLECELAATMVPEPLATRLRTFAAKEDELILAQLRRVIARDPKTYIPPKWQAGYSAGTLANEAMFCLARYEQTTNATYRDLLISIADQYLNAQPEEDVDAWPMGFAHVISAEVAAWRFAKRSVYLDQARTFAGMAVDVFWQDNPLPRASKQTGHYETITGADSLALALLEVHAAAHGLTNRIPSNNIDR
jgi:pectate lyase-like protein